MAELVDVATAESEVPIDQSDRPDHQQLLQTGLFSRFAHRRRGRALLVLEVTLREAPVLIAVANEEKARRPVGISSKDDATGRDFSFGALLEAMGLEVVSR